MALIYEDAIRKPISLYAKPKITFLRRKTIKKIILLWCIKMLMVLEKQSDIFRVNCLQINCKSLGIENNKFMVKILPFGKKFLRKL